VNELRKHYFLDRWVIIAKDRQKRPHDLEIKEVHIRQKHCPFDRDTLNVPILEHINDPWVIAVINNKFPALSPDSPLNIENDFLTSMGGFGHHEVIIDHYLHKGLDEFSDEHMALLMDTYALRTKYHLRDEKIKYVSIFRNNGAEAGASISHPHSQLMALPVVPRAIYREMDKMDEYFSMHGEHIFDAIYREEKNGPRMLSENQGFYLIAPYASVFGGEMWVIPKRQVRTLFELNKEEKYDLGRSIRKAIWGMQKIYPGAPYNLVVHQAPKGRDFRLHLEIFPRLNSLAGFELGNDMYINQMPTEVYAKEFREVTDGNFI